MIKIRSFDLSELRPFLFANQAHKKGRGSGYHVRGRGLDYPRRKGLA